MTGESSSVGSQQAAKAVNPVRPQDGKPIEKRPYAEESSAIKRNIIERSARIDAIEDVSIAVAEQSFSIDRLREMVKELEEALPTSSRSLNFRVDEVLNRPVITVVNKENGEIIRELPPKEVIRAVHNIDRMRGILFEGNG